MIASGLLLSTGACSPSVAATAKDDGGKTADGSACAGGFLGDGGAPALELTVIEADSSVQAIAQGGTVPLIMPPQGGRAVFVGVRATNLEACVQLTGALRDLSTQRARVDSRTVTLMPSGGGWGTTGETGAVSGANFANIAPCPNEWSATNIEGTVYGLEVTVRDTAGRTASQSIHVTPQCVDPGTTTCTCICAAGYMLGSACN